MSSYDDRAERAEQHVTELQATIQRLRTRAEQAEGRLTDRRGSANLSDTVVILRQRGTYDGDLQAETVQTRIDLRAHPTATTAADAVHAVLDALREDANR